MIGQPNEQLLLVMLKEQPTDKNAYNDDKH